MESYKLYMHNLPKVSEDGKESLPIDPHSTQEFSEFDKAKKFAAENKDKFDRVVLIKEMEGKQEKIERYIDGQKEAQG